MNLRKQLLTNNDCYKAGKKIAVKGAMIHSTGANNPKLSRYIQPDDGLLGDNPNDNDWNRGGISKCVHAFIGKLKDGSIGTYQTLDWNHRGWGGGGKSNDTHIHVEICEDGLEDPVYFAAVYKEAVELFAMISKKFNLNPDTDIDTHCEGYKKGIASNHADVMHWFPKHGKSMDTFRADVKALMGGETVQTPSAPTPQPAPKSIDQLAQEVIDGKYGSGDTRRNLLGAQYDAVQARVNQLLGGGGTSAAPKPAPKSIDQLAQEVIDGKHGSGDARRRSLGVQYDAVQARVNQLLGGAPKPAQKSIGQLADEVLKGLHGSGAQRQKSLGANYAAVQQEVNRRLHK